MISLIFFLILLILFIFNLYSVIIIKWYSEYYSYVDINCNDSIVELFTYRYNINNFLRKNNIELYVRLYEITTYFIFCFIGIILFSIFSQKIEKISGEIIIFLIIGFLYIIYSFKIIKEYKNILNIKILQDYNKIYTIINKIENYKYNNDNDSNKSLFKKDLKNRISKYDRESDDKNIEEIFSNAMENNDFLKYYILKSTYPDIKKILIKILPNDINEINDIVDPKIKISKGSDTYLNLYELYELYESTNDNLLNKILQKLNITIDEIKLFYDSFDSLIIKKDYITLKIKNELNNLTKYYLFEIVCFIYIVLLFLKFLFIKFNNIYYAYFLSIILLVIIIIIVVYNYYNILEL